jgi:glyoxalase family protein
LAISGIHHVTAFARSPRENIDFYSGILALRTVKITVNYDDPGTYHLYFADRIGTPGTVMTFFPWPDASPGRVGRGQATSVAFAVPRNAIEFWAKRLSEAGIDHANSERFNEPCITFADPDDLPLQIIGIDDAVSTSQPWPAAEVASDHAILGFHSVALAVHDAKLTIAFLQDRFGFSIANADENTTRMRAPDSGTIGALVDVQESRDAPRGSFGPGTVHHVAWRALDEDELDKMRRALIDHGCNVTEIKNRNYFKSIYFREPGGVIFEIATDGPGFTIDEPEDSLGSGLCLPPWMEPERASIAAQLPSLEYDSAGH